MDQQPSNCPSHEELLGYALAELAPEAVETLVTHLESCTKCECAFQEIELTTDHLIAELNDLFSPDQYASEPDCRKAVERIKSIDVSLSAAKGPPREATEVFSPRRLGNYDLVKPIGRGGMGTVYKAVHRQLKKVVALKILARDRLYDPKAVARFRREMQALGELDHDHLVAAFDAGEIDGVPFLAMEYVDGIDLSSLVRSVGQLSIGDACELTRQAAVGLQHIHEAGRVHRDIKPSNLMLTAQGQLKILDFGLALLVENDASDEELTDAGQLMGTLDYMAPEQFDNCHGVDIRADIFGLGASLYKLLTGHSPRVRHNRQSRLAKMRALLDGANTALDPNRPDVPDELRGLLQRMLARDRGERFSVPRQVAEGLQSLAHGSNLSELYARAKALVVEQPGSHSDDASPSIATGITLSNADPSISTDSTGKREPTCRNVGRRPLTRRLLVASIWVATGVCITIAAILAVNRLDRPTEMTKAISDAWAKNAIFSISGRDPIAKSAIKNWSLEPIAPPSTVSSVAWSPDGHWLAYGTVSGALRICEAETLKLVRVLAGHKGVVASITWSPNGRFLASCGGDGMANLWQPSGKPRALESNGNDFRKLSWNPDGSKLAAIDNGGLVSIWTSDGSLHTQFQAHDYYGASLSWSPDGNQLATGGGDRKVKIWDLVGRLHAEYSGYASNILSLSWQSKQLLAVGTSEGPAYIRNLATGSQKELAIGLLLGQNTLRSTVLSWSPDGQLLAGTSSEGGLRFWFADGTPSLSIHDAGSVAITWHPGGTRVATAGGGLQVFDTRGRSGPKTDVYHSTAVTALAWSKDGNALAVGTSAGNLQLWLRDGHQTRELRAHESAQAITALAWHPQDLWLAIASTDKAVQFLSLTGQPGPVLNGIDEDIGQLAWSPNGDWLAAVGHSTKVHLRNRDGSLHTVLQNDEKTCSVSWRFDSAELAVGLTQSHGIQLWTPEGHRRELLKGLRDFARSVAYSPTENILAAAGNYGTVGVGPIWGKPFVVISPKTDAASHSALENVNDLVWSPDGKWFATASGDRTVRFWQRDDAIPGAVCRHDSVINDVAWSPDGKWVAAGDAGGTVRLWNVWGEAGPVLVGHMGGVLTMYWNHDGVRLAVGSSLGTLILWDTKSAKPLSVGSFLRNGRFVRFDDLGRLGESSDKLISKEFLVRGNNNDGAVEYLQLNDVRE